MRVLLVLVFLAGCASTGEVLELGKDRYSVSATMGGNLPEWDDVKGLALTKAREHCTGLGRRLEAGDWKTSGARGWSRLRAELTYQCVEK
jgi:hypothetical protein